MAKKKPKAKGKPAEAKVRPRRRPISPALEKRAKKDPNPPDYKLTLRFDGHVERRGPAFLNVCLEPQHWRVIDAWMSLYECEDFTDTVKNILDFVRMKDLKVARLAHQAAKADWRE